MNQNLTEEENMVAFTAAPFLGDWRAMMKLGKKIEKMPGGLEQLHMMSLQLPIPDFTLVYDLCKEHKLSKQPVPAVSSLSWNLFNVKKIRVKFKDVDCGEFDEKRAELMAEIHKQGDVEWEDVPNTSHVHVKRMGALCQAVSFGEIPMMLNGPWLEKRIHVKGRAEMPLMSEEMQQAAMAQQMGGMPGMGGPPMPDPSQMTILVQEEEWVLAQDEADASVYKGTYALRQRPQLPANQKATPEHAPVNMIFECQVFLGEDKQDEVSEEKNPNDPENAIKAEDSDECVEEDAEEAPPKEAIITEFDDLELD